VSRRESNLGWRASLKPYERKQGEERQQSAEEREGDSFYELTHGDARSIVFAADSLGLEIGSVHRNSTAGTAPNVAGKAFADEEGNASGLHPSP